MKKHSSPSTLRSSHLKQASMIMKICLKQASIIVMLFFMGVSVTGIFQVENVQAQTSKESSETMPSMGMVEPAFDNAFASPDIRIMPPIDPQFGNIFVGQKHATSVLFRGNGDSFVQTRIAFTNTEKEEMTTILFELPTDDARNLSILQEIRKPQCIEYDYTTGARCIRYEDSPDYYNEWGESTFVFPVFSLEGNVLSVTLSETTPQYASGAIVIIYNSSAFVSKGLASFNYDFETIRSLDATIEDSRIGVSVENNFTLRNVDSEIDYASQYSESAMLSSVAKKDSAQIQSLSSQIQNLGYGQIVEYIEYLDVGESYVVSGAYAKSWVALYIWRIVGIVLAVIALVVLLAIIKESRKMDTGDSSLSTMKPSISSPLFEVRNHLYALVALVLFVGVMIVVHVVTKNNVVGYGISGGYGTGMLSAGFMAFIFGFAGLLALFSTPLLVFADRGWRFSIPVIILELVWAMIILSLYALVM